MKKQFYLILLLIATLSVSVTAQNNFDTFITSSGQRLVSVNVNNLLSMHLMSRSKWEAKLGLLGFNAKEIEDEGTIKYFIGSPFFGIQAVGKSADGISIMWLHSSNEITIMDNIMDELQDHYVRTYDRCSIYEFTSNYVSYRVVLERKADIEFLLLIKI